MFSEKRGWPPEKFEMNHLGPSIMNKKEKEEEEDRNIIQLLFYVEHEQ